ncbi:MAG: hypothetical protein ACE5KM_22200 [Planctomycetaceae bacterium]
MRSRRFRLCLLLFAGTLASAGCGINLSGFLTPVYRRPSGYSDTFRRHLDADDPQPIRKALLDPSLTDLPVPVPLPPVPNAGEDSDDSGRRAPGGSSSRSRGNALPVPPAPGGGAGRNGSTNRSRDSANARPGAIPGLFPGAAAVNRRGGYRGALPPRPVN